jgi:hypothetical protein
MLVKQGTYVGSGASNPQTGIGFAPIAVFGKIHGGTSIGWWAFKDGATTHTKTHSLNTWDAVVTSLTLDADGFTPIGSDANSNANLSNYDYIAIGAASANAAIVTWSGDNANPRDVGALSFQPDAAFLIQSNSIRPMWRTAEMAGDASQRYDQVATTDHIEGFHAAGITVGLTANTTGNTYWALCLKKQAGVFHTTEYVGDGVNDRNVAHGLTTTPVFAAVQPQDVTSQVFTMRFGTDAGDVSHSALAGGDIANLIQTMDATNVQLGDDARVNQAASTPTYTLITFASTAGGGGGSTGSLLLLGVGT